MGLFMTMRYEMYIFLTDRQLRWISACITSYRHFALQSQLMTCKTITNSLTCTEFSLSICQYLVLWISTIKSLQLQSNFRSSSVSSQTNTQPPPKKLSKIVSATLMKNLLHSIRTKKIIFC